MADDRAELIQEIKRANDIVDVVGNSLPLRPAGPTFKGLCPFHDDNRPSFDVDPRRQRYRCWSCGKHGDVISFVMEQDRVSFTEALELLARRAGISLEKTGASQQNDSRARMLDVMRWACEQFQACLLDDPDAEAARRYLGERRLLGETVVVTHAIDGGTGRVRIGDSEWLAKGPDAEQGTRMRVSGHDGTVLIVEHLH